MFRREHIVRFVAHAYSSRTPSIFMLCLATASIFWARSAQPAEFAVSFIINYSARREGAELTYKGLLLLIGEVRPNKRHLLKRNIWQ